MTTGGGVFSPLYFAGWYMVWVPLFFVFGIATASAIIRGLDSGH